MELTDNRDGDTTMSLRSTGSVLVVFLFTATVVLGQDEWNVNHSSQSICALKGSTVDLSCSFTYPRGYTVTATEWYYWKWIWTKIPDKSTGRVLYLGNNDNDCTLRITDLREKDSTSYYFSFQTGYSWTSSSYITLSVTDLQVQLGERNNKKTLTCITSCSLTGNPTYIWYKNGQQIDESSSPQYKDPVSSNFVDSYSCSVKGHEDLHSPTVCIFGQSCNKLLYTKRGICALKGSSVDISCTYVGHDPVTSSLWFSPKQSGRWRDKLIPEDLTTDPGYAGRVQYPDQESTRSSGPFTLRITDLKEEDSAEYRFTFKTYNFEWGHSFPGTTLTVTDLQVKMSPDTVTEGETVTLTCLTSCPLTDNPTYMWFKNEQPVQEDTSSLYVNYFSEIDSYSCGVKGHDILRSPAMCQKCWSVTYTSQSICALKGSSVDIPCSYTYPRHHEVKKMFWFTKWVFNVEPENVILVPGNEGHIEYHGDKKNDCTLRITDLRLTDSSEYRFRFITSGGHFSGSPVSLTVTDVVLEMEPTSVSEGNRVTLTCTTKCSLDPNPEYSWYKNGQPIENTNTNSTVHILSVSSEDAGRYFCGVKGHETLLSPEKTLNVTYAPNNPSVSISSSGEIVEGSSVTLTCSSDANPPVDKYTWYKKNVTSPKASGQSYSITNIRSEDRGEYYCEAENEYGPLNSLSVSVDVQYAPKNTSVSVSPSGEIAEGSSVTLTCSSDANPPVDKYTWYKKNVTSPKASGQSYSITNITSEDSGEYYYEAENECGHLNSFSVSVNVQYGPKNTSVSVSPSGEIVEGSSVTLTCSSDANPPVDKYTWYKKTVTSPKASGQSYNITNITSEDSGEYHCEAHNRKGTKNSTALMVIVSGKQTSVVNKTVGITVVVLVVILCLSGFIWFRRKKSKSTAHTRYTADNIQEVFLSCMADRQSLILGF
uniref:B-cell receptor CD22 n=1 Tax=Esox lucius TaxID=8010 RepID=A0A3P8YTT6_ESOLU